MKKCNDPFYFLEDHGNPTSFEIPAANFNRLAREISTDYGTRIKFTKNALVALHEASESFLVERYRDAKLCAYHAGRSTVAPSDLALVSAMQGGIYSAGHYNNYFKAYNHHRNCRCVRANDEASAKLQADASLIADLKYAEINVVQLREVEMDIRMNQRT